MPRVKAAGGPPARANIKDGRMFELSVKGDIASAHFLRGYEGKCKDLHGHTWKIEVIIASDQLDAIGMVADFAVLKKQLKEFLIGIDHVCLNDLAFFKETNPTTENIAKYIYTNFAQTVKPLRIKMVQVRESDSASVVYYE
jgi:6-pyruvoyltetrahydropterin/6-carboxytetrahydropterin synthase